MEVARIARRWIEMLPREDCVSVSLGEGGCRNPFLMYLTKIRRRHLEMSFWERSVKNTVCSSCVFGGKGDFGVGTGRRKPAAFGG